MPFLRLTRDRRGTEHTFLLHADRPGQRPRVLYWYRTAPDILLGRPPLDEDAIRTIEERHADIDFDWSAILALGDVMTHEDETTVRPQKRVWPARSRDRAREEPPTAQEPEQAAPTESGDASEDATESAEAGEPHPTTRGLLEELVGREIATRLRARHAEILARIHEREADETAREDWLRRADALDPDTWLTPDAILAGMRGADPLFDGLRRDLRDA